MKIELAMTPTNPTERTLAYVLEGALKNAVEGVLALHDGVDGIVTMHQWTQYTATHGEDRTPGFDREKLPVVLERPPFGTMHFEAQIAMKHEYPADDVPEHQTAEEFAAMQAVDNHASDCATHNGPCDCDADKAAGILNKYVVTVFDKNGVPAGGGVVEAANPADAPAKLAGKFTILSTDWVQVKPADEIPTDWAPPAETVTSPELPTAREEDREEDLFQITEQRALCKAKVQKVKAVTPRGALNRVGLNLSMNPGDRIIIERLQNLPKWAVGVGGKVVTVYAKDQVAALEESGLHIGLTGATVTIARL